MGKGKLPKGHLAKRMRERQQQKGLPSMIQIRLMHGNLWAFVVKPMDGFVHLSTENAQREAREKGE